MKGAFTMSKGISIHLNGCIALVLLAFLSVSSGGFSEEEAPDSGAPLSQLAGMSLEDLADIQISSVSKRKESQLAAAAAVYVITAEDIRRSAATNIPDLLRVVPGLHVARLDANKWSVSSRGFSGRYANSLLVLVDGRSVYTPFFSGTYWETRDVMLEDVSRIEIIRGPGGALWGANAVNGVINIVTKDASETQGGLFNAGVGTEERAFTGIRYGGKTSENGTYRLYLKYSDRDRSEFPEGGPANDDWLSVSGGARFDWDFEDSHLTLQGDVYGVDTSQTYVIPVLRFPFSETVEEDSFFSGGNILGRWKRTFDDDSELSIQAYYDRSDSNILTIDEDRDTFDLEVQYRQAPLGRHELMWGVGFRYVDDRTNGTNLVSVSPESRNSQLYNAFLQDRITLIGDVLVLTMGSKFEHNSFTGVEIQPSVRLAWTPSDTQTVWAALSRSVRTPSFVEDGGRVARQALPLTLIALTGNDFKSEELLAFEAGYRYRPNERISLDLSVFLNEHENLRTLEFGRPFIDTSYLPIHFLLPVNTRNNMDGKTYGAEVAVDWHPTPWWRARLSYSYLEMDLDLNAKSLDIVSGGIEKSSPEQQVSFRNSFDLSPNTDLDFTFRYVDQLPALSVDDYFTLDARIGWRPRESLELALVGRDLLNSEQLEFSSMFVDTRATNVQRGVYGKITWKF